MVEEEAGRERKEVVIGGEEKAPSLLSSFLFPLLVFLRSHGWIDVCANESVGWKELVRSSVHRVWVRPAWPDRGGSEAECCDLVVVAVVGRRREVEIERERRRRLQQQLLVLLCRWQDGGVLPAG